MYAKQRQVASNAWNGGSRNNLRTRAPTHTHIYICMCLEKGESGVKEDGRGGCRLYTVADSLGPEDISQRGWSRSDPEGCLVLKPPPSLPPRTLAGQKLFSFARATGLFHAEQALWNYERERSSSLFRAAFIPGSSSRRSLRLKGGSLASVRVQRPNLSLLPLRSDRALPGPDVCARSSAAAEMRATFCANYGSVRLHRGGRRGWVWCLERGENERCRIGRVVLLTLSPLMIEFCVYIYIRFSVLDFTLLY